MTFYFRLFLLLYYYAFIKNKKHQIYLVKIKTLYKFVAIMNMNETYNWWKSHNVR